MGREPDRRSRLLPLKTAEASVADVVASPTSVSTPTLSSSPSGFDGDRRFSLYSITSRARRSLSGRDPSVLGMDDSRVRSRSSHSRKLSKTRNASTGSVGPLTLTHRVSSLSDDLSQLSVAEISRPPTAPCSTSGIDWLSQRVEGINPLEPDTHLLRTKNPFLVVTSDYLLKVKSGHDLRELFPSVAEKSPPKALSPVPEPLLVVPLSAIVAVFVAESTRPSFGMEVWWKSPAGISFQQATFFFKGPGDRDEQIRQIARVMGASWQDDNYGARLSPEVLKLLHSVHESEEPVFGHRKPAVYPVVPRASTRKEYIKKADDSAKKPQENPSFYLLIGTYLCHFVVIQKGRSGEPVSQHKSFGLVTLESFRGDRLSHEERFNIAFRNPLAERVTLELASFSYKGIIRVFRTADRYLKPVWPNLWQSTEIFHIKGLEELRYLLPSEDFGSVRRTLDAYTAAYGCRAVKWEINWKTKFPPEFRVLPAEDGSRYSPLQLLAVLRALRYNDYFHSLSFRDVDLGPLWSIHDPFSSTRAHVAYLSRSYFTLDPDEIQILHQGSLLHQEFHALAFCSETIQQIDFTNTTSSAPAAREHGRQATPGLQFLTPILTLLRSNITKCSNLILSGNALLRPDLDDIIDTLGAGKIHTLDVSSCGLCEQELRDLLVPFVKRPHPLRALNLSGNFGRLPAGFLLRILYNLVYLRELNLRGSLRAGTESAVSAGSSIYSGGLEYLYDLEELDLSSFKLTDEVIHDLINFLRHRTRAAGGAQARTFRKLVLNRCGITGHHAAMICRALANGSGSGSGSGIHLYLSGNPLEEGIEYLANAIRENCTPTGLDLELIEFKEERNYVLLIKALAENSSVSLLSLAGTAPMQYLGTIHQPCSGGIIEALSYLFAENRSIRYLDLSGFSGKLEDGQLPRGFGRALTSLRKNTTMTYLKIRNQNLHDVTPLGQVLRENGTLRVIDWQGNELNFTAFGFLVDCLKENHSIIEFPFGPAERAAIWKDFMKGLRKVLVPHPKSSAALDEAMIQNVVDHKFKELDKYLRRNRLALSETSGQLIGLHLPAESLEEMEDAWLALESDVAPGARDHLGYGLEDTIPTADWQLGPRRPTVRSSCIGVDMSLVAPYHVRHGQDGVESPTDTLDPASEISTPPEMASTPWGSGDFAIKGLMEEFRESGFVAA